jgi:hypothetical protein
MTPSPISGLPAEIVLKVASYLDTRSFARLAQTCRDMQAITEMSPLIIRTAQIHGCDSMIFEALRADKIKIDWLVIRNFTELSHSQLELLYRVKRINAQWAKIGDDQLSYLQVEKVNLSETDIRNVSGLYGIRKLNLHHCKNLVNVSALRNAHTLRLSWCTGIRDCSALGGLHKLNLCGTSIVDVSMLGGVHTLNLSNCDGIRDFSALRRVHTLDLSGCINLTDVSALGGVHTLSLACCKGIRDVSVLCKVHTLNLSSTNIIDVSMLGGVYSLNINKCYNITDVSALRGVPILQFTRPNVDLVPPTVY